MILVVLACASRAASADDVIFDIDHTWKIISPQKLPVIQLQGQDQ